MDPLITSALVKTGGDLIAGLFAPSVKTQLKRQRESAQKMAEWQAGKIRSTLKPATPYYQSGNLPQLGSTAMSAVMGNLMQRLGPEMLAKWGINPAAPAVPAPGAVMGGGPSTPALPGPGQVPQRQPLGPMEFPGQDMLLKRYGMAAR